MLRSLLSAEPLVGLKRLPQRARRLRPRLSAEPLVGLKER